MKPSEIINLREGFWGGVKDAFAKKGWFGQAASAQAWGKEAQKKIAAQAAGADAERIKGYIDNLAIALAKAYNSGLVTTTIPEAFQNMDYGRFSLVLENNIVMEAMSGEDFVLQYVKDKAKKEGVKITPDAENTIKTHIGNLLPQFRYNPSIAAEKHKFSPQAAATAGQIFNVLLALKSAPGEEPGGSIEAGKFAPPKTAGVKVEIRGNEYEWDGSNWKDPTGADVTAEKDIEFLNKQAYTQEKNKPRVPGAAPAPSTDVPIDRASGGVWKPEGATNSYTFNKTQGKWYMHRAAPAGSTSSSMPALVTDPKTIERLNKLWDEKGELE